MEEVLKLKSIKKAIGRKTILKKIDLTLEKGEILGIIGPNGAGKSTLLKIISGTMVPTAGSIEFSDRNGIIGIVPETPAILPSLDGFHNLQLLASIRGKIGKREIKEAMETVGLDPSNPKPVGSYSLGMKQRLMLAQSIMEKPRLLLLDEPTNGLDPLGIIDLRSLLFDLSNQGVAVIIASHLLREIEVMCHRVIIFNDGHIIREVNLRKGDQEFIEIGVSGPEDWDTLSRWVEANDGQIQKLPSKAIYKGILRTSLSIPQLLPHLTYLGVRVESIQPARANLEAAFLESAHLKEGAYR